MNRILLTLALFTFSIGQLAAQAVCATDEKMAEAIKENPASIAINNELEEFTASYIASHPYSELNSEGEPTYVIPVVFHIMHDYSANSNIPKENCEDAIRILNEDFNGANSDTSMVVQAFKNRVGGLNIEFRLATIDPDGNCTDGVTRTYTPLTVGAGENVKSLISWNTRSYYNIWVVKSIGSSSSGTTLGYTYKPGVGIPEYRVGILIRSDCVGSLSPGGAFGNQSIRTLTHETGHWLNLSHTWGDGAINTACNSDLVYDTPQAMGTPSGCPTGKNSCPDTTFYGFDQIDNLQNHMEYTSCNRMFTIGQAERMEAALNSFTGYRKALWDPANLANTGVDSAAVLVACNLVPDFSATKTVICPGSTISLTDLSWNGDADTRTWSVTGPGTVNLNSTTAETINATFTAQGQYTVTLTLTNAAGTFIAEKVAFIGVISDVPVFANWYNESFEGISALPVGYISQGNGKEIFKLNNNVGWATSSQSVWIDNFQNASGDVSSLILPTVEVPNTASPVVSFDYAYANRTSNSSEELKVYVSSNCGASWSPRLTISNTNLTTAPNSALNAFHPTSVNQWKSGELNLSAYKNVANIAIKFELTSGQGNNFYLDNINLKDGTLSTAESFLPKGLQLQPNPVTETASISFDLANASSFDISVIDLMGKQVINYGSLSFDEGSNEFNLDLKGRLPAGVYLIRLANKFGSMQERFVISE